MPQHKNGEASACAYLDPETGASCGREAGPGAKFCADHIRAILETPLPPDAPPSRSLPKQTQPDEADVPDDNAINDNDYVNKNDYVEEWQLDPAINDYVKVRVHVNERTIPDLRDPKAFHDDFELGSAYYQGEHAEFDYRWCNAIDRHNMEDRRNGFVPCRESLDNRHPVINGAVTFGDTILMRRPKEITAKRAEDHRRLQDRMTQQIEEYEQDIRRQGGEPIGGIRSESLGDSIQRALDEKRQSERGTRTFAINAPYQTERLNIMSDGARRSLGAVGG